MEGVREGVGGYDIQIRVKGASKQRQNNNKELTEWPENEQERTANDSETGGKKRKLPDEENKETRKSLWCAAFLLRIMQSCLKLTERHRDRRPVQ